MNLVCVKKSMNSSKFEVKCNFGKTFVTGIGAFEKSYGEG